MELDSDSIYSFYISLPEKSVNTLSICFMYTVQKSTVKSNLEKTSNKNNLFKFLF